jgi:hypothetical protein
VFVVQPASAEERPAAEPETEARTSRQLLPTKQWLLRAGSKASPLPFALGVVTDASFFILTKAAFLRKEPHRTLHYFWFLAAQKPAHRDENLVQGGGCSLRMPREMKLPQFLLQHVKMSTPDTTFPHWD